MSLRLLSYNIRFGGVNRDKQLAAVINSCEPDAVILQEATRPDVIERLAPACGMKHWGALPGHSLAFLSRRDVSHHAWRRVPWARRRYLELDLTGGGLRIFGVHLSAIHSNVTEQRRLHELRSLLGDIGRHQHGFHTVTGDFNTLAPGEQLDLGRLPARLRALTWMTGRTIRWRTIQLMIDRGYVDAFRFLHKEAEGFTFPTRDPHIRLDFLFVPQASVSRLAGCEVVREAPGVKEASDHFPLLSIIEDD